MENSEIGRFCNREDVVIVFSFIRRVTTRLLVSVYWPAAPWRPESQHGAAPAGFQNACLRRIHVKSCRQLPAEFTRLFNISVFDIQSGLRNRLYRGCIDHFTSDGHSGDLNEYFVLKR